MILSRTIADIFFFIRWINPNKKNEADFNPQYSTVKHRVNSFAEWSKRAVILDAELARRYRPDTFMRGERTATFRTLQEVVRENKRFIGDVQLWFSAELTMGSYTAFHNNVLE